MDVRVAARLRPLLLRGQEMERQRPFTIHGSEKDCNSRCGPSKDVAVNTFQSIS